MISLIMAALGLLALFFLGRWLFALVLETLLVPDWRREDFELHEFTDWKREQEGRSGDAAERL